MFQNAINVHSSIQNEQFVSWKCAVIQSSDQLHKRGWTLTLNSMGPFIESFCLVVDNFQGQLGEVKFMPGKVLFHLQYEFLFMSVQSLGKVRLGHSLSWWVSYHGAMIYCVTFLYSSMVWQLGDYRQSQMN